MELPIPSSKAFKVNQLVLCKYGNENYRGVVAKVIKNGSYRRNYMVCIEKIEKKGRWYETVSREGSKLTVLNDDKKEWILQPSNTGKYTIVKKDKPSNSDPFQKKGRKRTRPDFSQAVDAGSKIRESSTNKNDGGASPPRKRVPSLTKRTSTLNEEKSSPVKANGAFTPKKSNPRNKTASTPDRHKLNQLVQPTESFDLKKSHAFMQNSFASIFDHISKLHEDMEKIREEKKQLEDINATLSVEMETTKISCDEKVKEIKSLEKQVKELKATLKLFEPIFARVKNHVFSDGTGDGVRS